MKNVKKMLTEQADKILPDDSVKENIKRELNISASEAALSYAHGGESSARTKHQKQADCRLCRNSRGGTGACNRIVADIQG